MYLYMEGSKGEWEGANPIIKWAPNGLNLIQGCQPPIERSKRLSVNSGRLHHTRVGDMPKSPSSQYGLKAQEDIDTRGIRVTNGPMRSKPISTPYIYVAGAKGAP
jgi:hypothetical protein